jgi:hypothetical protein
MNKETNIDCMKYRKSTHLAGVDVETIIAEKGNCILTIKEAYYAKNVDVSGNKTDGYFIDFVEGVKSMVVNSVNRKTISSIVKINKGLTSAESRNIGNWIGTKIELLFDENVKMMGKIVGGIRINPISPIPDVSDENAIKVISESKTLKELQENWSKISKDEQKLPTVNALKEKLKQELK